LATRYEMLLILQKEITHLESFKEKFPNDKVLDILIQEKKAEIKIIEEAK